MENLSIFIAWSTVLGSGILQGLAVQGVGLALWRIFNTSRSPASEPFVTTVGVRRWRLCAFIAMMAAVIMRETAVVYWGAVGPWPVEAIALSGASRWLLILAILMYVAGETYNSCRHRCWVGFLAVALVYGFFAVHVFPAVFLRPGWPHIPLW